jgi:SAM-dependent methyltransferase
MGADGAVEFCALMASIHASPGAMKFGEDAALYDYARPAYPAELFAWLQARCGLNAQSGCFEIGAGTGHATLPVLATPVRSLLAIEPDVRLAERLREKAGGDARLMIEIARFEDARLEDDAFDFGFAAMSLHWLARMKALARVRAALKPGGHFAMWWNVYHNSAAPDAFGRATEHLFAGVEQDPNATAGRPAFALDVAARLGELRSSRYSNSLVSTGFPCVPLRKYARLSIWSLEGAPTRWKVHASTSASASGSRAREGLQCWPDQEEAWISVRGNAARIAPAAALKARE